MADKQVEEVWLQMMLFQRDLWSQAVKEFEKGELGRAMIFMREAAALLFHGKQEYAGVAARALGQEGYTGEDLRLLHERMRPEIEHFYLLYSIEQGDNGETAQTSEGQRRTSD